MLLSLAFAPCSLRSSPEQKPLPAPVRMMARTLRSRSASRNAAENDASMPPLIALSRSGRLSVMVATLSLTS